MTILKTTVAIAASIFIAGVIFIYSGVYDVSAMSPDGRLMAWALHTTMERSVARRAGGIDAPDLANEEMQLAGIDNFDEMCAICHTPPGGSLRRSRRD